MPATMLQLCPGWGFEIPAEQQLEQGLVHEAVLFHSRVDVTASPVLWGLSGDQRNTSGEKRPSNKNNKK